MSFSWSVPSSTYFGPQHFKMNIWILGVLSLFASLDSLHHPSSVTGQIQLIKLKQYSDNNICSLAIFGVTSGKRGFLLPWLLLFVIVKIFLMCEFLSNIVTQSVSLSQVFLLLLILSIMTVWRHMQAQYIFMGLTRPSLVGGLLHSPNLYLKNLHFF